MLMSIEAGEAVFVAAQEVSVEEDRHDNDCIVNEVGPLQDDNRSLPVDRRTLDRHSDRQSGKNADKGNREILFMRQVGIVSGNLHCLAQ